MKNLFTKHYKEILLTLLYCAVAIAVYVCWFHSLWHLWYVDLAAVVVILICGFIISFFWIRSLDRAEEKKTDENPAPQTENKA